MVKQLYALEESPELDPRLISMRGVMHSHYQLCYSFQAANEPHIYHWQRQSLKMNHVGFVMLSIPDDTRERPDSIRLTCEKSFHFFKILVGH